MRTIIIGALAALSLAFPAVAKQKEPPFLLTAVIKDKPGPVAVDPAKGYVLVRSEMPVPLYLMKIPSAEDQARWERMRTNALAEARAKYAKKKKSYDSQVKDYDSGNAARYTSRPVAPIEPTEANFEFTPFPLLAGVSIGPLFRFAKADGGPSTYLQDLTPGDYRIYGPLAVVPGASSMGSCFCMGSIAFTVRPGEITDLGLIAAKSSAPNGRPDGDSSAPMLLTGQFILPATSDMAVDSRLAGAKIVAAKYRPIGKLPNFFGVTIGRIPAIPGVLRYDRDRIVDLTTGN